MIIIIHFYIIIFVYPTRAIFTRKEDSLLLCCLQHNSDGFAFARSKRKKTSFFFAWFFIQHICIIFDHKEYHNYSMSCNYTII